MLRAKCSFLYPQADGSQGYIRHGDVVDADHPAAKGRGELFVNLDPTPEKPAAPARATRVRKSDTVEK